jgi:hypothetical protein
MVKTEPPFLTARMVHMCPDSEMLSLYIDSELPSPWKEKLEAHIRVCPGCRERLEQYRNLSRELNADTGMLDTATDAAKDRVWETLAAVPRRPYLRPARFWGRTVSIPLPLAAAAAAVLILGFGLLLFRQAPAKTPQDGAMASGFGSTGLGMDMQTIPAVDMNGVLQYLGNDDTADIVIIRLPESKSFMSLGEPSIMKAADYSRRTTP